MIALLKGAMTTECTGHLPRLTTAVTMNQETLTGQKGIKYIWLGSYHCIVNGDRELNSSKFRFFEDLPAKASKLLI